jgi:hypothetical protein
VAFVNINQQIQNFFDRRIDLTEHSILSNEQTLCAKRNGLFIRCQPCIKYHCVCQCTVGGILALVLLELIVSKKNVY